MEILLTACPFLGVQSRLREYKKSFREIKLHDPGFMIAIERNMMRDTISKKFVHFLPNISFNFSLFSIHIFSPSRITAYLFIKLLPMITSGAFVG